MWAGRPRRPVRAEERGLPGRGASAQPREFLPQHVRPAGVPAPFEHRRPVGEPLLLVELVRGLETTEATLAAMGEVAARMGKEVVVVREAPGFVTSRINALIGNEAFAMLEAGVASARDIDKALKLGLNHPMGPFEMVALVGLDVRLSILQHLHQTLGDTYRPSNLLAQYVRAGRLGRKTGKGVYVYDEEGNRIG